MVAVMALMLSKGRWDVSMGLETPLILRVLADTEWLSQLIEMLDV
jgi:hypothetical protein